MGTRPEDDELVNAFGLKSPAHDALVEKAQTARKCLVSLLNEGSRDFDVMLEFFGQYRSFQMAADVVLDAGRQGWTPARVVEPSR